MLAIRPMSATIENLILMTLGDDFKRQRQRIQVSSTGSFGEFVAVQVNDLFLRWCVDEDLYRRPGKQRVAGLISQNSAYSMQNPMTKGEPEQRSGRLPKSFPGADSLTTGLM
jgi:hypothetical protein